MFKTELNITTLLLSYLMDKILGNTSDNRQGRIMNKVQIQSKVLVLKQYYEGCRS